MLLSHFFAEELGLELEGRASPSRHPAIVDARQEFCQAKARQGPRLQIDASAPKDVTGVAQRLERFQNRIARRAMPSHFRADGARTISGRSRRGRRRAGETLYRSLYWTQRT